ncbi:TlpA family protein disulfide reductase [Arcticibacter tournemirensis]|uniref:TlpA family protein disulfide reductase n=1 Tax=Arcticibacter tournemirensis TaxID=699437 RepID=A0A4Q0M7S7_9SPHI|nr:TlpA disulfide reductase family protein [Arcticibacter tournemirensis]RXF68859.1 TlpA family protein disulfide reductase [Arcticibacter tournemirensis]
MSIIKYIKSNVLFILSVILLIIIVVNPDAKAFLIKGLMKTGLYSPDMKEKQTETTTGIAEPYSEAAPVLFKSPDGQAIDLSKLRGKVVFLNFWATWCPPCIAEMPSVNKLYEKLKSDKDFVFLMVDVDANYQRSKKFMDKHKYSLPVYTPLSDIPKDLLTGAIPTTVILDKDGKTVFRHEGAADYSTPEVIKFMQELSR